MHKLLEKQILESVSRLAPPRGQPVLALSGGMDSVILFHALLRVFGRKFSCAHVNHSLRGQESDADAKFVAELCARHNITLHQTKISWADGENKSAAACRAKRYDFFSTILGFEDRLFLAHHLDDQVETFFLRLLRGTGVRGLGGMRVRAGQKVRPLLPFAKADLAQLAREWKIEWREDSSNSILQYDRNWLRAEVIPLLAGRRPGFKEKIFALTLEAQTLHRELPSADLLKAKEELFWRPNPESPPDTGVLSQRFALSRAHSTRLAGILAKGGGNLSAEGSDIQYSSGVVRFRKRGSATKKPEIRIEAHETILRSELGEWRFASSNSNAAGFRLHFQHGDKLKKEFQEKRIPVFFRDSVPIVRRHERVHLLLPGSRIAAELCVKFAPSALGTWFFNVR